MENIAVSQLQSKLRSLGYLNANATGYYGTTTASAVKNFQKVNELDADGKVGISTWNKVFSSSAVKAPVPSASPEASKAPETEA
jgi:peptidoglycan hydrolase-like protein with peptidoglycan-binding domain